MNQKQNYEIKITSEAAHAVRESLQQEGLSTDEHRLRVGANNGGCSGWRWELESEELGNQSDSDQIFESEGIELIVKSEILNNVFGSILIDYSHKNIVEQGFMIIRPTGQSCGCGESLTAVEESYRTKKLT